MKVKSKLGKKIFISYLYVYVYIVSSFLDHRRTSAINKKEIYLWLELKFNDLLFTYLSTKTVDLFFFK